MKLVLAAVFSFCVFSFTFGQSYSDSFESPVLDSFWSTYIVNGSVEPANVMSHSGTNSLMLSTHGSGRPSGGDLWAFAYHNFPVQQKGKVSVWLYDTAPGKQTLYAYLRIYGENGYVCGIGIMDWDAYSYNVHGPGLKNHTPIFPRSLGWHLLEIDVKDDYNSVSIDGIVVYSYQGDYKLNSVYLYCHGPYWRPNATYYFDEFNFTANVINTPPTAQASPDQIVRAGLNRVGSVKLDGSSSYDPDGQSLSYLWTWLSQQSTEMSPTSNIPVGKITVTLIVNDGQIDSAPDTIDITVLRLSDLNGDMKLDITDFNLFRGTYGKSQGQTGFNAEADYDKDGVVSLKDYQTWYTDYKVGGY